MSDIDASVSQQKPKGKSSLTHFLSIPINNENVVEKFIDFKNNVSMLDRTAFIDGLFQKKWKLHLTLGVLSLQSDEKINSAKNVLQESREIIENVKMRFNNPGDINFNIQGVKSMTPNPANCRVLYGAVENDFIQTVFNEIVGHFISKGLIEANKNRVKLHVTMMNVDFVNEDEYGSTFDARNIVQKFENYEFGEQKIEEIHLSKFGTAFASYYQNDGILNIS